MDNYQLIDYRTRTAKAIDNSVIRGIFDLDAWNQIQADLVKCRVLVMARDIITLYNNEPTDFDDRSGICDELDAAFEILQVAFEEFAKVFGINLSLVNPEIIKSKSSDPVNSANEPSLIEMLKVLDGHAVMKEYADQFSGLVVYSRGGDCMSRIEMSATLRGISAALFITCRSEMFGDITYTPNWVGLAPEVDGGIGEAHTDFSEALHVLRKMFIDFVKLNEEKHADT